MIIIIIKIRFNNLTKKLLIINKSQKNIAAQWFWWKHVRIKIIVVFRFNDNHITSMTTVGICSLSPLRVHIINNFSVIWNWPAIHNVRTFRPYSCAARAFTGNVYSLERVRTPE